MKNRGRKTHFDIQFATEENLSNIRLKIVF